MDENDRRLASSVGVTLEEASRNMRQAHARFSGDYGPTMRQRIEGLRREEEILDPVKERRRYIESALADDHIPTFLR